jgi:hypothetical protein
MQTPTQIRPLLDREWDRLRHRPSAVARARSWQLTHAWFDDLDGLLQLAGHGVASTAQSDDVLRRILHVGRHDELAARIALQRILPGLLAVVRRRAAGAGGPHGLLEELVGAAWISIRSYDLDRRPSSLAAALVWSAEHRAFRTGTHRRAAAERAVSSATTSSWTEELADPSTLRRGPDEELFEVLSDARSAGIDDDDLLLVRQLLSVGSIEALAAELGVTSRTIRNRRDRVTYRVRRAVLAA